ARGIIRRGGLQTEIVHQGHDSLVLHGPVEELFDLCTAVAQSLAAPREYRGVDGLWELAMPVGWGVGRNLSALHEWKVAPSRDESLEIARTYPGSPSPSRRSSRRPADEGHARGCRAVRRRRAARPRQRAPGPRRPARRPRAWLRDRRVRGAPTRAGHPAR